MEPYDNTHHTVAVAFAASVRDFFSSEDTLKDLWAEFSRNREFDRTTGWNSTLRSLLRKVWKQHGPEGILMLDEDVDRVVAEVYASQLLDFNLFTQVMLNLQKTPLMQYLVEDATKRLGELQNQYEGVSPSPFAPKAKLNKTSSTPEEVAFNNALYRIRALKSVASISSSSVSFRVSPIGSTPALADSQNLSSLGIGADEFLVVPGGWAVAYLTWEDHPTLLSPGEEGTFRVEGIPYPFVSKSGGDMLDHALHARRLAYDFYGKVPGVVMVPRVTSLMLLYPESSREAFRGAATNLPETYQLHDHKRNLGDAVNG